MSNDEEHPVKVGDHIRYTPTPEMASIRTAGEGIVTDVSPVVFADNFRYRVMLDELSPLGSGPVETHIYSDQNTIEKLPPISIDNFLDILNKETPDLKPTLERALGNDFMSIGPTYGVRTIDNKNITFELRDKDQGLIDDLKQTGCPPALVATTHKGKILATFKHGLTDDHDTINIINAMNKILDGKATNVDTRFPKNCTIVEATGAEIDTKRVLAPAAEKAAPEKRHHHHLDAVHER